jgi:superfamily II DNA or RNA helicase
MLRFVTHSPLNCPSTIQREANDALNATPANGFVVLPCGVGKTAVLLKLAIDVASVVSRPRILVVCFEKLAVGQVEATLKRETTLAKSRLHGFNGRWDTRMNAGSVTVTTYAALTRATTDVLAAPSFDLVAFDEAHHIIAASYRAVVETLVANARRAVGLTATLVRHELVHLGDETPAAHEQRVFGWFGTVLHRAHLADAVRLGILAKTFRMTISCALGEDFGCAHAQHAPSRQHVCAVAPEKLQVVCALAQMHTALGHSGVVFAQTCFAAATVAKTLGPGWVVFSGSASHGDTASHSTATNAALLTRFNDGALRGIVATSLGESAIDLNHETFSYAIVLNFHAGRAAAMQRIGRLSRTPRLAKEAAESDTEHAARQRASRKRSYYYEVFAENTEEAVAASARDALLTHAGYALAKVVPAAEVRRAARAEGVAVPFEGARGRMERLELLKAAMVYRAQGDGVALGKLRASALRAPVLSNLKKAQRSASLASTSVMRAIHQSRARAERRRLPAVNRRASEQFVASVRQTQLDALASAVFRRLPGVGAEELDALNVPPPPAVDLLPSDDE